eukprot:jgi/Ulvmu1/7151/UM034_0058.1
MTEHHVNVGLEEQAPPTGDLQQEHATENDSTSPSFDACCLRFGMGIHAAAGWRRLCAKPFQISSAYFCGALLFQAVSASMWAGAQSITSWHAIIPHSLLAVVWVVFVANMWRFGPVSTKTALNAVLTIPHMVSVLFIAMKICVGPDSWVPYGNRPLSVILLAFFALFVNTVGNCGAVPTVHPEEPHKSIQEPLIQASLDTVRIMDVLTDASTIRLLLRQAHGDCFWFGTPGQCGVFWTLVMLFAALVVLKFVKGFIFFLMKNRMRREDRRGMRLIVGGLALTLVCDLGIASVTLVNIYSISSNPPSTATSYAGRRETQPALRMAFLSCASTVIAFCVNLVGLRSILRRVRIAVRRLSERATARTQLRRSGAHSSMVSPATVTPSMHGLIQHVPVPQDDVRGPVPDDRGTAVGTPSGNKDWELLDGRLHAP